MRIGIYNDPLISFFAAFADVTDPYVVATRTGVFAIAGVVGAVAVAGSVTSGAVAVAQCC